MGLGHAVQVVVKLLLVNGTVRVGIGFLEFVVESGKLSNFELFADSGHEFMELTEVDLVVLVLIEFGEFVVNHLVELFFGVGHPYLFLQKDILIKHSH